MHPRRFSLYRGIPIFQPPGEAKLGLKNRGVQEIDGKNEVFV